MKRYTLVTESNNKRNNETFSWLKYPDRLYDRALDKLKAMVQLKMLEQTELYRAMNELVKTNSAFVKSLDGSLTFKFTILVEENAVPEEF